MRRYLAIILVGMMLSVLAGCTPQNRNGDLSAVRFNEVQTSGANGDWIELYNTSDQSVDLSGCFLTNDANDPGKWRFPNGFLLESNTYRVLYCDNSKTADTLNFRLSAGGVTLYLSNPQGAIATALTVPAGASGLSYGWEEEDRYVWYASPTPNGDNRNGMVLEKENTVAEYGLRINEYMTANRSVLYDENGDYSDWVEIYNFSEHEIDLGGYFLTDSRGEAEKWSFPEGTRLPAGGYLLVRCSGKNTATESGELHTNFKLGAKDSFIGLYTKKGLFCSGVNYVATEQDRSRVYTENGYRLCRMPTPGFANSDSYLNKTSEVTP